MKILFLIVMASFFISSPLLVHAAKPTGLGWLDKAVDEQGNEIERFEVRCSNREEPVIYRSPKSQRWCAGEREELLCGLRKMKAMKAMKAAFK
ncbi:MAG: hypothetical protein ACI9JM_000406 [Halioglobus sp.]|jgi:hypothetical protein